MFVNYRLYYITLLPRIYQWTHSGRTRLLLSFLTSHPSSLDLSVFSCILFVCLSLLYHLLFFILKTRHSTISEQCERVVIKFWSQRLCMCAKTANLDMSKRNVRDVQHARLHRVQLAIAGNYLLMMTEQTLNMLASLQPWMHNPQC